jgi:histidinol-phosphate/aromatic aminotransferase/cobyric acid decarboxylase-like protein
MFRSPEQYDYSQFRTLSSERASLYLDYNEYHGGIHQSTQKAFLEAENLLKTYFRPGDHSLESELAKIYGANDRDLFLVSGADHALEEILGFCKNRLNLSSYASFHQTTYDHFYTFTHKLSLKNLSIDLADILYVCCPNNPDGVILTPKECLDLALNYKEKVVVFDFSYLTYSAETYSAYLSLLKDLSNVFVLSSLAKVYPIAGLRSGWFCTSHDKAKKYFSAYLNAKMINPVARKVLKACLHEHHYYQRETAEIFSNRNFLAELMMSFFNSKQIATSLKYELNQSGGNFFSLAFNKTEDIKEAIRELEAVGILVRYKSHWDFIRITSVNNNFLAEIRGRLKC